MEINKHIIAFFKGAADFCKRELGKFAGPDYAHSQPHQEIERLKREVLMGMEDRRGVSVSKLNTISQLAEGLPKDGYTVKLAAWAACFSSGSPDLESRFADLWFDCLSVLPTPGKKAAINDAQRENKVYPPRRPGAQVVYSLALKDKVDLALARKMHFGRVVRSGPRTEAVL